MISPSIGVNSARICIAIGFLSLSSSVASAQTESAAARALFSEGRELMDAERFEEACPKFEESLRLDHGMGTQFNLAHCWEKQGRTASAWALFLDVAAAARAGNQPQREAAARERAKALEPKLARLRITVPDAAPDTKVTRDGQDVGKAAWGTAMPVDPGEHVIRVTAPGKQPWSQEMKVAATSRTSSVTVPPLEDAPAPVESSEVAESTSASTSIPVDVEPSPRGGSNGQAVAALVIGGVGVAALAAGTIFALQSRSNNSEALKLCRLQTPEGDVCQTPAEQERHQSLVDDAKREQLLGYVGFGVGGAAVIAATLLYVTANGTDRDDAGREAGDGDEYAAAGAVQVAPLVGPATWGASLSGRF